MPKPKFNPLLDEFTKHPNHFHYIVKEVLSEKGKFVFRSMAHVDAVIDQMYELSPGLLFGETSRRELQRLARQAEAALTSGSNGHTA